MTCVRQISWLFLALHAASALKAPMAFGQAFDPGVTDTGISIQTQIYRVFEDGSKQVLESPVPVESLLQESLLSEKAGVEPLSAFPQAEPQPIQELAAAEIQPSQAVFFDPGRTEGEGGLGAPTAAISNELAFTDAEGAEKQGANMTLSMAQPEPATNRVKIGERLHYALTIENTNGFSIPAGGLEILEELAQGVLLQSPEADLTTEAFVGVIAPRTQELASGFATSNAGQRSQARAMPQFQPQAQSQKQISAQAPVEARPMSLRWQNTRSIAPAERLVVGYDVEVAALITPEVPPPAEREATEESVNGLDSSRTQLQLP